MKPLLVSGLVVAALAAAYLGVRSITATTSALPVVEQPDESRTPSRIVITAAGESVETPTYDAEKHQNRLKTPARWCASPRADEPLLREAAAFASGPEGSFMSVPAMKEASVAGARIRIVTDEATCEKAARAYDRVVWSGGVASVSIEEHTSLTPVLVVKLDDVFLVDDLSDRDDFWNVVAFDRDWNQLFGGYGGVA